ncbi:DNA replication complex GINS protein PSF1-like [Argonauta hians]
MSNDISCIKRRENFLSALYLGGCNMLGNKALELIKELSRASAGTLPPYNEDCIRQILDEMKTLYELNQKDVNDTVAGEAGLFSSVQVRHAALERNKRCLLAYLYKRLETIHEMRWEFGSVLPVEIRYNMSEEEVHWFNRYNKVLAAYMRNIAGGISVDLTQDMHPPKSLYIEVRCLVDHGEFETQDGNIVVLKRNNQHFLLRSECESLIRQGILEHVIS